MRLGAALACLSLLVSGLARADDWSLTRPAPAPRAGNVRPRPAGQGAAAAPADTLERERLRYLQLLLRDPTQRFAFDRLLALYRERDGNLDRLASDLGALRSEKPERYAAWLLSAELAATRGELDAARAGFARAAELAPRASAPLSAQAAMERAAGDVARADSLLEQAFARATAPDERAQLLRELADSALAREDYATAEQRFALLRGGARAGVFQATEYARALSAHGQHARAVAAYQQALAALRGDDRVLSPVLLELARARIAAGDAAGALADLERARKLAPSGSGERHEIDETLLATYRELGRLPELAARLAEARATSADANELLGRVYDELGDPPRALEAYRAALARNPRALELRQRVIAILSQQGEFDAAVVEYRALLAAAPREPRHVIELGKALFAAGKRDEALRVLDQAAARFPRDARIVRALLDVYARWNERERAARMLNALRQIEPDEPAHVVALGEQLLERGDEAGALAVWRKITALGADKARAHATLGATLLDHDMAARALPEYEAAVRIEPERAEYLRGLAETLEKLQRSADAAQRWQQVLELSADREQRREARRRVVRLWAVSGDLGRRIADLERGTADPDPARAAEAGRFLAEAYRVLATGKKRGDNDARNLDAAERVLGRVLALDPADLESMVALERLRTLRGNLSGAIEVLQRLLTADPKNAQTYLSRLSQHSLALYRDDDAIAFAERSAAQSPSDPRAQERLGDLYRAHQDVARAIASYERAVALDDTAFAVHLQLAELYGTRGDARAASAALSRVVRACTDDDLVKRAGRSLIALDADGERAAGLEQLLRELAIANTRRPIYRALLVELYEGTTRSLRDAAREASADGQQARDALRAIAQRAVKPLLEALTDSDDAQRRMAIELLGHIGSEHTAAALLAVAEQQGDSGLRRAALVAAGASAPDSLAPRFAALARAQERRLRDAAAWALGRMRGQRALVELRGLLASNLPAVRGQAALGLGRARDLALAAALEKALRGDPSAFVRGAAALGLGMSASREAHGALASAVRTERGDAATAAALALGMLGERAAAEPLADALFSEDATLRAAALWSLRWLVDADAGDGTGGPRASAPALREPEERPALSAELAAWLALTPHASVDAALAAFDRELHDAAAAALQGPAASARVALSLLSGGLAPLSGATERDALERLSRAVAPVVAGLGRHPDRTVRAAAIALAARDNREAASATTVLAALDDGDEQVQSAALDALAAAGGADQPAAVRRLAAIALGDARWWIRRRAVAALARAGGDAAAVPLAQVLTEDHYAYVREAAAKALGELRAERSVDELAAAFNADPEARVRGAAGAALRSIGTPRALRALDAR